MSEDITCLLGETPSQLLSSPAVADLAVVFIETLQEAGFTMYDALDIEALTQGVHFRSGPFHFYAFRGRAEHIDERFRMLDNIGLSQIMRDTDGSYHIGLYEDITGEFSPTTVSISEHLH